ncbi:S-layer homology domain-containing protein [Paenibacillus hamazuiensis]|uniref:S-layer homology domain-containing protein n=1 Tax=Paenibacillus hamazuiensis TaxID=2936508 RepID=UPI00200DE10A|nr:S-layer homology domain-containing protein [Paenibacillus hamazuiensis]
MEALAPVVPPGVTLGGIAGYRSDGTPIAGRSSALTIAIDGPCDSGASLTATDAGGRKYTGQLMQVFGAAWSHRFNPSSAGLTGSLLSIEIVGCGPVRSFGIVLIDPSGIVYNAARGDERTWPLPDATVILEYYDPSLNEWVKMNEDDYPGKLSPVTNPQNTGEDGRYAWDAAAGRYRVVVSRPGFQPAVSRIVDVPPAVTDLHVGLTPVDHTAPSLTVASVTYGETYTHPVTMPFSASDEQSGVRYISYRLDGGEENKINGAGGSLSVNSPGFHTVRFTAVDHAGNEQVKQVAFTIALSPEPEPGSHADLTSLQLTGAVLNPAFAPGTTSYSSVVASGVSAVTVTASVYDAAYATVKARVYDSSGSQVSGPHLLSSGVASPPLPLKTGSNVIKLLVTAQDDTAKTYTVTVTREAPSSGGGHGSSGDDSGSSDGGSVSPGGSGAASGDAAEDGWTRLRILIDGKQFDRIAAAASSQEGGVSVFTVKVDAAQLAAQLAEAGNKPVIVIPTTANADKVTVVLTGDAVKSLESKMAVLEIRTSLGNYVLPAAEVRIDSLSKQLEGGDKLREIQVKVDIAKGDSAKAKWLENAAVRERFTVVVPPVDFTVTASFNGKKVNAINNNAYPNSEVQIPLPDDSDPGKMTTAIVPEEDGSIRHVPTSMTMRSGKYEAIVRGLTSGTYSLIWHPAAFADVEGHWAESAVNDMGARMIINGVDENRFGPDAAITRAELAAIIVRALGLSYTGEPAVFTDVKAGDWYAGAVAKAYEYGIIEGYEDLSFRPANTITRQEGMMIIARVMKLVGLNANTGAASEEALLSPFADGGEVQGWARREVAAAISVGLIGGSADGLQPNREMSRAETAVIVQRLLEKAGLIGNKY